MTPCKSEQPFKKVAVVLINTGTPEAPTTAAVRQYLAEFLSDTRVIELPKWKWWPILHGIILRFRPAKSAKRYQGVWTPEGSPLIVHTQRLVQKLQQRFCSENVQIVWAMRYGNPSVSSILTSLQAQGFERLLILPMFAQYAPQTTASCLDAVYAWAMQSRTSPALRVLKSYHDEASYIDAVAQKVLALWQEKGPLPSDGQLVISFHGVPQKGVDLGDRYEADCYQTARLLAQRLQLQDHQWKVAFQSRFGKEEWLKPYAIELVQALAHQGVRRIDIVCPGFSMDCLETVEEIEDELRAFFLSARPEGEFNYISALNADQQAVDLYEQLIRNELSGWIS